MLKVKLSMYLIKNYSVKTYEEMVSFTPQLLHPRVIVLSIRWVGGWVGHRNGLNAVERRKIFSLPGLKFRFLGLPARSPSPYKLGSCNKNKNIWN
jgi:hypothetical protein